jgi:SAM-dependent methyltransferase
VTKYNALLMPSSLQRYGTVMPASTRFKGLSQILTELHMSHLNKLSQNFELILEYTKLYAAYTNNGINKTLNPHDPEHNFDQDWKFLHYFDTGADALRVCLNALIGGLVTPPKSILDFPSGSGRVTRHFKSFFSDADIVACDLYDLHYKFCSDTFGVTGVKSTEHFDSLNFDRTFDLIFCGSLLTHLPEDDYKAAIRCMIRALSDNGVAVITLQGRRAEFIHDNRYKFIDQQRYDLAMSTVPSTGFGYVDYSEHWMTEVWKEQSHYGVAMVRPNYAVKNIEAEGSVRILGFTEQGWDDAQDVLIIRKPGIDC